MNDNRKPMSPLGKAIFDMMNAHNQVYATSLAVQRHAAQMRDFAQPVITERIVRPSQAVKS